MRRRLATAGSRPVLTPSDGVPGWFGGVLPSAGHGPSDGTVSQALGFPSLMLLQPVVVPALRIPITQTCPPSGLIRHAVLEVARRRQPPASRPGAAGVPDLGQVPEQYAGVMPAGLVSVVAGVGVDRHEADDQVRPSGDPGG